MANGGQRVLRNGGPAILRRLTSLEMVGQRALSYGGPTSRALRMVGQRVLRNGGPAWLTNVNPAPP